MSDPVQPSSEEPVDPELAPAPRGRPTVVGIGASAGGLAALRELFACIPPDSGLVFVVVVHLAPDHESHLADLLQPHAPIPVQQVTDVVALEANHAYVIPPGRNLSAIDSHLRVSPLEKERLARAPIDHFFRTLAETHDGHSVGVLLSGTGGDGTEGLRHVREQGGMAIVQDPNEAEYDGMLRHAIAAGVSDMVLPIAQMLPKVMEFAATEPRLRVESLDAPSSADQPDAMEKILALLRVRTGHDFARYKRSTVGRRVARRMQILGVEQLPHYLDTLREGEGEAAALLDDLLINVTSFFRDPQVFRALQDDVVPRLLDALQPGEAIRVWSVGCATGEEAYSLGMLLLEEAGRREKAPRVQVFATDLHERSLHYAREALYPQAIEAEVSPERLERFFRKESGGYRVGKQLRESVVFALHNLLRDPPFSRLDLIVCRNVLIYLQADVQREVVELFHYALRPDGVLLLGTAETLSRSELFRVADKEHHLYARRNAPRGALRLPALPISGRPLPHPARIEPPARVEALQGYGAVHQKMVERYAPPSLLVNQEGSVVHLSEHAGRYLQHGGGVPTNSIFKLVREELRVELRAALHAVKESGRPCRSHAVPVRMDGEPRHVVLRVSPSGERELEGFVLVIFDEMADPEPAAVPREGWSDGALREMEAEMELMRSRLVTVIEEFETSQEEMRSSNEEMQSSNEELRSTMEELETSREELQSVNEELQTLNQENKHKVEELSQISSDLQNLLQATDVATLFLDRKLRILRFTPQVGELFNVRESDRGRPLADLTHRLGYGGLIEDARRVLQTLVPVEHEVETEDGRWFLVRVMPYRTMDDRIEGVVLTFVDVTALKRSEAALRGSEASFRAIADLVPDLLWRSGPDGATTWYNQRWTEYTGQAAEHALGFGWAEVIHAEDREGSVRRHREAVEAGEPLRQEYRIRGGADGAYRWFLVQARPVHGGDGAIVQWFGAATDIHEERMALEAARAAQAEAEAARRALEQAHAELERRVDERTAQLADANDTLALEIRERERAEAARSLLLRQIGTAEEEERRRISRELHDQMGQLVTALLLGLKTLPRNGDGGAARIAELEVLAGRIAREMQDLALVLRPPALDNLGLELALRGHLEEWSERHGVEADFQAVGVDGQRFSRELETTLYRMVQEGLTNVLKHAGASRVSLLLESRGGSVNAILEDNGAGFDVDATLSAPEKADRLGLRGMRERIALVGGTLEIESAPGSGTTVYARVPAPPSGDGGDAQ
ncbi:MAG TPA: CheR family methyltransferase [Longimicrobiaceae bacterium]|jgi:two-component system CheB/CheR fusion protein|nr:CheR family methyltransferase [Longimicrobiaceae bacterium]